MPHLHELDSDFARAKQIAKHLRENFKFAIDFNKLSVPDARRMKTHAKNRLTNLKENRGSIDNKDGTMYTLVVESLNLFIKDRMSNVNEDVSEIENDSIEEAEVIIAAQAMAETMQKMIQDIAEMQVQDLLPLVDRMKEELGQDRAAAFEQTVDTALGGALESVKQTKSELDNAIMAARGIASADTNDMEFDSEGGLGDDEEYDVDPEIDGDMEFDDEEVPADVAGPEPRELKPE